MRFSEFSESINALRRLELSRAIHGSWSGPRVRSGSLRKSAGWVGKGREEFRNVAGRLGSGQEAFESRGSDRNILTRSDPREVIGPAK